MYLFVGEWAGKRAVAQLKLEKRKELSGMRQRLEKSLHGGLLAWSVWVDVTRNDELKVVAATLGVEDDEREKSVLVGSDDVGGQPMKSALDQCVRNAISDDAPSRLEGDISRRKDVCSGAVLENRPARSVR